MKKDGNEEMELYDKIEKSVNDKIYTPVQSETMTKKRYSIGKLNLTDMENCDENHQRLSWLTNNCKQRKETKTYAAVLQIGCEKRLFCKRRY